MISVDGAIKILANRWTIFFSVCGSYNDEKKKNQLLINIKIVIKRHLIDFYLESILRTTVADD